MENEGVVNKFLASHNYKLLPIDANFSRGIDLKETVRIYPFNNRGEGQFVAVLQKNSGNTVNSAPILKLKSTNFSTDFFKNNTNLNIKEYEFNGNLYYVPNVELIKKSVNFWSLGVLLGETNKVFKPSHFVFSAFGKQFKNVLNFNFNAAEVQKYLKGENLIVDFLDCYGVIIVNNCPLGGFKISDGKFKNLYPKGLRN